MEAHRAVRRRGSHIFSTTGSHKAASLSALRADRHRPPVGFLVLTYGRGSVNSTAIGLLKGLGQMKIPITSSVIEPVTFLLVA
jgi:hypothetical protein